MSVVIGIATFLVVLYLLERRRKQREAERLASLVRQREAFERQWQDYERRRAEQERIARVYTNAQAEQLRRQQEQQRQYDEAVRAFLAAQQQNYYQRYAGPQSYANAQQAYAEQTARAKAEIKRQTPAPAWQRILGPCETREAAEAAYRAEAKKRHPDLGGNAEAMQELNQAIKEARLMLPGVH